VEITHEQKQRYEKNDVDQHEYQKQPSRGLLRDVGISFGDLVWARRNQRVKTTCDKNGSHDRELVIDIRRSH
jgi:hypothetical protein